MSIIQALKKRARFLFRLIVAIFNRLCCCFKRKKNIGELPYTIKSPQTHWQSVSGEEKWEGWSSNPFVASVEEKISEYRRKKTQSEEDERVEVDFFNDMQPKVIQTPRVYINQNTLAESRNLFAVKTDQLPPSNLGELGNLEDTKTDDDADDWDNQINIEDIDNVLREQRAKERQERRLARQMEHAKRFERRKE